MPPNFNFQELMAKLENFEKLFQKQKIDESYREFCEEFKTSLPYIIAQFSRAELEQILEKFKNIEKLIQELRADFSSKTNKLLKKHQNISSYIKNSHLIKK